MKVNTKKNNKIIEMYLNDNKEKLIVVKRAKAFNDGKIIFDMIVNDVTIYGCRLLEGKNGMFVSFPSRKGNDNKYYNIAYVSLSEADIDSIVAQIEKM